MANTPNKNARIKLSNIPPSGAVIELTVNPPGSDELELGVPVVLTGGVGVGRAEPACTVEPGMTMVGTAVGTTAKAGVASVASGVGVSSAVVGVGDDEFCTLSPVTTTSQ